MRIKSTIGKEIILSKMTETTHRIAKIMERHDRSSMGMNRLCENAGSVTETLSISIGGGELP
jgi:hypothetical protein